MVLSVPYFVNASKNRQLDGVFVLVENDLGLWGLLRIEELQGRHLWDVEVSVDALPNADLVSEEAAVAKATVLLFVEVFAVPVGKSVLRGSLVL